MGSDRLVIALVGMNLVLGTTLLVQGRRASAANDPKPSAPERLSWSTSAAKFVLNST